MYIKRVELSHFKSFGGTTQVPLLPGFTVISGPNGSGKSNILDALLFALGLAGSKGMRAERLPDLVNQNVASRGRATVEASVTVTFALDDMDVAIAQNTDDESGTAANGNAHAGNGQHPGNGNGHHNGDGHLLEHTPTLVPFNEWTVTRKLRVTQQGTYTSNYYINSQPCTLNELHEQLHRFHIYPEGYNVVLQGDVTGIISMNPRERREIVDELAGVASFDRKISQAKEKLDAVKEREEKFRIVEKELIDQRDRLAQDRIKAEKYQRLRGEFQTKGQWEGVLAWRNQERQLLHLQEQIAMGDRTLADLATQITGLNSEIEQSTTLLEQLNAHVKALGEDEQLALQSTLATREAELRQVQRQEQDLATARRDLDANLNRLQRDIHDQRQTLERLTQERQDLQMRQLSTLQQDRDQAQAELEQSREAASAIASASEAWVQEQTALRHHIEGILQQLEPQRTEQARLQERLTQLRQKMEEQQETLGAIAQNYTAKQAEHETAVQERDGSAIYLETVQKLLKVAEDELHVHQETQSRLLQEQREKQRQLDKLEAQVQAMRETQGTGATQWLLDSGITGMCGLVAQLGRVDPNYQLALEIAAGGRLGNLVVEDDGVAAAAIELLKQRRAGRATFLPLNKIRAPHINPVSQWDRPDGFVDYAVNLIECDDRYRDIFAYVFGNTVVFQSLNQARRHIGRYRIVTLDGELLESSGAMTGGSVSNRSNGLRFGTVQPGESEEAIVLRDRLRVIETVLARTQSAIAETTANARQHQQKHMEARQRQRELELQAEQLQSQITSLVAQEGQLRTQLSQQAQELATAHERLQTLERELPHLEAELARHRQTLNELEASQTHHEWQQMQARIREQETRLSDRQLALRTAEQRLQDLDNQGRLTQEKIDQCQHRLQEYRTQQTAQLNQQSTFSRHAEELHQHITQTRAALAELEKTLTAEKQERDRAERQLRDLQASRQQVEWQQQKLQETQRDRRQEQVTLTEQVEQKRLELPDPLPEVPETVDLVALQHELRSLQKRLQAMEPVNMLALEEYDRTQTRLDELSQKLGTLEEERTELLMRIENFTTLRLRAFREAFDAVNANFQTIFAQLSDGDGYLQLDNADNPFDGGLNLVAHPKGKPVRRLASMSGGEKSLTALSFIFALQRYRPSPFYAFDEVDMFLDGANVERLARMIKHQAQQAQFIVVSLRRPMIESAERTIGVTQARGAYTQVLGLNLQVQNVTN